MGNDPLGVLSCGVFFCLLHGRRTPLEFSAVYNGYYTHCVSDRQNYLSLVLFTMVTIHIVCPADQNFSNVVFFTMVTMHIVCPTDKTVPALSKEI